MKVLYLAPLLPAASGNGGKRAVFNHLLDALGTTSDIDLIVVDVEASGDELPKELAALRIRTVPRALPRGHGMLGRVLAIGQWLFDRRPRAAAVVASAEGRRAVREILGRGQTQLVVVDHLNAWSLLEGNDLNIPIQYIAHNVETDVLADQLIHAGSSRLARLWLRFECKKMRHYERNLLDRASIVTVISSDDRQSPVIRPFLDRVQTWPELPDSRIIAWHPNSGRRLLFVGSAAYFPNRDAIEWLVRDLMPALARRAPDVVLHLAGTSESAISKLPKSANVVFEGFVPNQRLSELHQTCSLFVCPVVLGSGIKIKVLEASAYGLPIAATAESLKGIDYLDGLALRINRDPEAAALSILTLLGDPERLAANSANALAALARQRRNREPLLARAMSMAFHNSPRGIPVSVGLASESEKEL